MAIDPVLVSNWRKDRNDLLRLKPAHGLRPVKWLVGGAGAVTPGTGELLGSTALARKGLIGGSRFHLMQASNTGVLNSIRRWLADLINTATAETMGTVSISGGNTVTRTAGSWLTEGVSADDFLIFDGTTTLTNAVGALLTSVSADGRTLTFPNGTFSTAENLPVTASIWRGINLGFNAIVANAGNATDKPPLNYLSDNMPGVSTSADTANFILGQGRAIFVAVAGTALAAGNFMEFVALGGDC